MSKLKILMVHNYYQIGGGEHTVFENEVELLRKNGHEVVEYTRDNKELNNSIFKLLLLPFTTIFSFRTFFEVTKIIRKESIDLVHCHNTFPLISPSVYYAAIKEKVPMVQTIHNFRLLCPNGCFFCNNQICEKCREHNSFVYAIKNRCYRNSVVQTTLVVAMLKIHRILGTYKKINYIFLTDFNKLKFNNLIDINSNKVFVKPNYVKTNNVVRNEYDKSFVYVGRLDENKGILDLLKIWDKMPSNYSLHIYGIGSLLKDVLRKVKNSNNIIYYGFKDKNTILNDLSKSAALIFPSMLYEGFPMTIIESMSVGCPVIAANIGNGAEIISQSNGGLVYNTNDSTSLITATKEILNNNIKYSNNAIKYYENELNEDGNYRILSNIYNNIRS